MKQFVRSPGIGVIVAVLIAVAHPSWAGPEDVVPAVKTHNPPVIDGVLDDEAWKDAPKLTGFTNTRDNRPAPDKTNVYVLYDDEYIYIGAEMFEDPDTISATVRKYDRFELRFEDYLQVWFDTFDDDKRAYVFLVSPLGTRWDARDGVFSLNSSWDSQWPAAAKILEDRWVMEAAIPIADMQFKGGSNVNWGINFRRSDRDSRASSHWSFNPDAGITRRGFGPKTVADFGTFEGLDLSNVKVSRKPQFETYVSQTTTRRKGGDWHTRLATGLDMELTLNSQWTTTFTVNPDFGQVEADSDDITLRDTERFFPERRTFFNEGAELFQSPMMLYNSRRINDIDWAFKATGTGATWSAAVLDLEGEGVRSGEANFLIGRYTMDVTDKLQLGAVWISADRDEGYNYVAAFDTRLEITPSITWTTQYAIMEDKDTIIVEDERGLESEEIVRKSGHAFTSSLDGGKTPLFWQIEWQDISEDFNPDLGFIRRRDIIGPSAFAFYSQQVDIGPFEQFNGRFRGAFYQNHDGVTMLRDFDFEIGFDLKNDFDFTFKRDEDFRKPYDNRETGFEIDFRTQDRLHSIRTEWTWGVFQDVPFEQFMISKPYGIGDRLTAEVEINFRREDRPEVGDTDVWLVRWVNEYTWKWDGRIRIIIEESSENRYNRTILFAYEDVKDWDFFVLLNDTEAEGETVRGMFTKFVYRF